MSKMKEFSMTLDEAIEAGEALIASQEESLRNTRIILGAVKDLKALFSGGDEAAAAETPAAETPEKAPAMEPAPVAETPKPKTYTKEEVRKVLSEKSGKGYRNQVRELLKKYGAANLSSIDPNDYAAVVAEAEALDG